MIYFTVGLVFYLAIVCIYLEFFQQGFLRSFSDIKVIAVFVLHVLFLLCAFSWVVTLPIFLFFVIWYHFLVFLGDLKGPTLWSWISEKRKQNNG